MILDATMNENVEIEDSNVFSEDTGFDEADILVAIEQAYGEVMMEQTAEEFKSYVENGTIVDVVNEGFVEKAKNFIKAIWNKIKMYFKKFMNVLNRIFGNCFKFYKKRTAEINAGCNGVEKFKGYKGLKNFGTISAVGNLVSATAGITRRAATNEIANLIAEVCQRIAGNPDPKFFDRYTLLALRKSDEKEVITYTPAEIANVLGSEQTSTIAANSLKSIEACLKDASNSISATAEPKAFKAMKKVISIQTRAIMHCTKATKEVVSQANSYAHRAVSVAIANAHGVKESADLGDAPISQSDEANSYLASIGVLD